MLDEPWFSGFRNGCPNFFSLRATSEEETNMGAETSSYNYRLRMDKPGNSLNNTLVEPHLCRFIFMINIVQPE